VRILYCGSGWLDVVGLIRARLPAGASIEVWDRAVPLARALADVQVILPSNAAIDAAAIAAPRELALIQQPAAGVENIDRVAAAARGVPVCNAPGANHVAVAEAALLLILALARRYRRAEAAFERREIGSPLGLELSGRTLGIIGPGRSGRALAGAAEGLGMTVRSIGSRDRRDALVELMAQSDVISLHCPLTAATRNLIDDDALARVKRGALLVNCARGPIVDRAALERALDDGRLGGVGLDVYWQEPWDPDDPLFGRDDVITLPHVGGSTEQAFARIADIVAGNVSRVMRGESPLHRVS
jgi:phosphoglycerate dehydrogenase-like enzyme